MIARYTVVLMQDSDDSAYTVVVPALPGCISQGATLEAALANAEEAIALHTEGFVERGEAVPVELGETVVASVAVEVGELVMA